MVNSKCLIVATLLSLGASSIAAADQQSTVRAEVPQAVAEAVAVRYPDGQGVQFAKQVGHGVTMYSVRLAVAGAATKLCVAPTGGIQLEQQAIAPTSLPEAVQRSLLASGFEPNKVIAAERVIRPEHEALPTYDILVGFQGVAHAVSFDGMGELVLVQRAPTCIGEPGAASDRIASNVPPSSESPLS